MEQFISSSKLYQSIPLPISLQPSEAAISNCLIAEEWILPIFCVQILSRSHLLKEAITHLFEIHNPISADSRHWVLLDYGVGRDIVLGRLQYWRSHYPDSSLVVLEVPSESAVVLDCIEAGAHAYALQGSSGVEIMQMIEQVDQGLFQCSPEITLQLFQRLTQEKFALSPIAHVSEKSPLTQREMEVLHYIAGGHSDREIAIALVISVRTVKHHVHNLLQKLNVRSRWQAAQIALEKGWIEGDRP